MIALFLDSVKKGKKNGASVSIAETQLLLHVLIVLLLVSAALAPGQLLPFQKRS